MPFQFSALANSPTAIQVAWGEAPRIAKHHNHQDTQIHSSSLT